MKNNQWFPWNGSKRWLLPKLNPIFKQWNGKGKYIEPFVGGGSVSSSFRELFPDAPQVLGDANRWLMSAYQSQLEDSFVAENYSDIDYWRNLKDSDFDSLSVNERANRFAICLFTAWGNRWETAKDGKFRSTINLKYCNSEFLLKRLNNFFAVKHLSNKDTVLVNNWSETLKLAESGDLVYIDSPYPESLGYGNNLWTFSDHLDVVDWIEDAVGKGISVVASNMLTVERLYKRIGMETVAVEGPKASKTKAARQEVIAYKFRD